MRRVILCLVLAGCGGDDDGGGGGPPTAFRFTDLDLRDPHIFVDAFGCMDLTNGGVYVVNDQLQMGLEMDDDGDGNLDLAPVIVFRPLAQAEASGAMSVYFANCTAPASSTMCSPGADAPISETATNMQAGTCLSEEAGTTNSSYSPAITTPSGPCFTSGGQTIPLDLSGIMVTLRDARLAATYSGDPATEMTNGLLKGFLTEADADAATLPADLPLVGGMPVSSTLPGGTGNCAPHDDRDMHNGMMGWWFYLNFQASTAPWSES